MNPTEFFEQIKKQSFYEDQLIHVERFRGRQPRFKSLKRPISRSLAEALQASGTQKLYSASGAGYRRHP
jgi:hypothetical protein